MIGLAEKPIRHRLVHHCFLFVVLPAVLDESAPAPVADYHIVLSLLLETLPQQILLILLRLLALQEVGADGMHFHVGEDGPAGHSQAVEDLILGDRKHIFERVEGFVDDNGVPEPDLGVELLAEQLSVDEDAAEQSSIFDLLVAEVNIGFSDTLDDKIAYRVFDALGFGAHHHAIHPR